MKSGVVVFPGSNRERDMLRALETITGTKPVPIWHADTELPDLDLVVSLRRRFSYGDYLRTGAIAARRGASCPAIAKAADKGVRVLGICKPAFQILCEAGLLTRRADAQRGPQIRLQGSEARSRECRHGLHA